jgi:hypothetical protein
MLEDEPIFSETGLLADIPLTFKKKSAAPNP